MVLWIVCLLPFQPVHAQSPDVETLLGSMTVDEKVGQLFLVAFVGNDPQLESDIGTLIAQDHIGGVVFLASNSNFYNGPDTPRQVAELSNGLQALALGTGAQVPLFVAVDHEGDGYPYTRIRGGTTPLPNAMAIGATWDTGNARAVGQITGRELAAMGINLLLGPSLDVLVTPRPSGQGDIGTRTFGGSPWWVGEMGQAYIEGVHQGSGGRVATVAKHFPGHGGSDRLPDEEVATVDKSLEELRRVELVPFFAVTGREAEGEQRTDALMSSHIRYRGIQGHARQFTAPISFDAEGMSALLGLDEFSTWRSEGLLLSDSLGVPAVRKHFDPTLNTFPHRRIAKEAFLAGNDMLLLSQYDLNNVWTEQFQNIRDTIAFFRQEYQANPAFASRVEEAVRRILIQKLTLYPELTQEAVQVLPQVAVQVCGLGDEVTYLVAGQALTLLYPGPETLPPTPARGEKIVIFTDARPVRECFTDQCQPFSPLGQTAVEEALLRIVGPEGTGQIAAEDITSLPFGQLKKYLTGDETQVDMEALLNEADWILFVPQDLNPVKGPNSDTVKLFLNERLTSSYDARLVVLALNAPYYLDTTEISKLSLYLVAYAKTTPFVETAVRALFGEVVPRGASPVDVEGVNYELAVQLQPDPAQTIPLERLGAANGDTVEAPTDVYLRAGPLLDRNGNPVADGTVVNLYAQYVDSGYTLPASAATSGGIAEVSIRLAEAGRVRFRAESGPAGQSETADLVINAVPTPTVAPSATPQATAEPTPTPTPTPSPTPTEVTPPPLASQYPIGRGDLWLALGISLAIALSVAMLLARQGASRPEMVRGACLSVTGGMVGYILVALQVVRPGSWGILPDNEGMVRLALVILVGLAAFLAPALALSAVRWQRS